MSATAPIFAKTPQLLQAVALINRIDESKFSAFLSRIMQKFHLKDQESFTEDEEEKLQVSLSLKNEELKLIIETLTFIIEQAAYHLIKPTLLQQHLEDLSVSDEKVISIAQAWANNAKSITEKLRTTTLASQLSDVNWQLRLQLAQSSLSKLKQPVGVVEFVLSNDSSNRNLQFEFTQDQLYKFYDKLETIQIQLDSLR